jgi:hypothetical protein
VLHALLPAVEGILTSSMEICLFIIFVRISRKLSRRFTSSWGST